jgi:uncharacterized protein (TIGR02246 family)
MSGTVDGSSDLETSAESRAETRALVTRALDGWKRGIDEQRPADVASWFTDDALFQGSHPQPSFGPAGVESYYGGPDTAGLGVEYEIVQVRRLGNDAVSAFVDPTFSWPDGRIARGHLSVVLQRQDDDRWLLCHYHLSRIS